MAAPSLSDGISRAINELLLPSAGVLGLLGGVRVVYGAREAGIAYVVGTAAVLAGIYLAAKYWNAPYTAGFVATGLVIWIGVPGVAAQIIPPQFADFGAFIVLTFLIGLGMMLTDKW